MSISELSNIGIWIGIIGGFLVFVISVIAYFIMKKDVASGKYEEHKQQALSNTDISIKKAVEHLKIVNTWKDSVRHDEEI